MRYTTLTAKTSIMSVVIIATTVTAAVPAGNASPSTSPTRALDAGLGPDLWTTQAALDTMATKIEIRGKADPTFASVVVDATTNSLVVYRTGPSAKIPDRNYSTAASGTATVRYEKALLSAHQATALTKLVTKRRADLKRAGLNTTAWGTRKPGGPFIISYEGPKAPDPALLESFTLFGAGTVQFARGGAVSLGRFNDTSPFYGGGRIKGPNLTPTNRPQCSSGFGALSNNGLHYLLTAAHCVQQRDTRFWTFSDLLIGDYVAWDNYLDTAYIKTNTLPRIFDGAYPDDSQIKSVVGMKSPHSGDLVCTSGSYVRAVCNARTECCVTYSTDNIYSGQEFCCVDGWQVVQNSHSAMATPGDSGGPIFSNTNGNTQAIAQGTISAADSNSLVRCPSFMPAGIYCYYTIFFADISRVAAARHLDFTRACLRC